MYLLFPPVSCRDVPEMNVVARGGKTGNVWLGPLLCLIMGAVVYGGSLDVPFYLDDYRNILDNPVLRLDELSLSGLQNVVAGSTLRTRPVANITFALNYYVNQENPAGYHLVNITIHILAAFFLYQLTLTTLATPALKGRFADPRLIASFAALLWLVHPLHTQTVTYVVQRMNGLATMFYLLSLWLYALARVNGGRKSVLLFAGALGAGIAAVGSKEIGATLPFFVLLYEGYFFQNLDRDRLLRRVWLCGVPLLFVCLLLLIYVDNPLSLLAGYEGRPFTMVERLMTQGRVVLLYVGLLALPWPGFLSIDHQIEISRGLLDPPTTLIALVVICVLLVGAVALAGRHRLLSFTLLWYFGNLVIESTVLPLELVFEHRTYLPSVFMAVAASAYLFRSVRSRRWAAGLLVAILAVFSLWTIQRNELWRDPVAFWADAAAKSPQKARPLINLSVACREQGDLDCAIRAAERAINVDARFVNGFVALGTALAEQGNHDGAIRAFQEVLRRKPDYAEVYNSLAGVYLRKGMVTEAVEALRANLRLDPDSYEALVNLASIKASQGMYREAIGDFNRALELRGPDPDIFFNLAIAYTQTRQYDRAVASYRHVLALDPADREAAANLEKLLRMAR